MYNRFWPRFTFAARWCWRILDFLLRVPFVELTDTDDAVLQARDEVDVGERPVVAILPLKQHCAVGLDLDERAVTEPNVPCTMLSSLQKTSLQLVMWLVVPVSRYQPSWI